MTTLNRDQFISTLGRLVALARSLQNSAATGKIPCERLAAEVVLSRLGPHIDAGALHAEIVANPAHPDRTNLILTLPGSTDESIGFVGAHFDVVPADRGAEGWTTDPFSLLVENDGTLRGRGVTDCLGHVALLTELLRALLDEGIRPRRTIHVVMIANEEESNIVNIGFDYLVGLERLNPLKKGPVFWLDSADFGPTLGTGGIATWELVAEGVPGHSGMPHNCVNALELGMTAALDLARWFSLAYPPHPDEARWRYQSSSSLKSTVVDCDNQKITMIPGVARIRGDIRLTPFYDMASAIEQAVARVVAIDGEIAAGHAEWARFRTREGKHGSVRLVPPANHNAGMACRLDSPGYVALSDAIRRVRGEAGMQPSSMTGSLPLVRTLQDQGFDIQITGFGRGIAYHAPNEFGMLKDFEDGFAVLCELIERL
ncbi:MAG TPA: M20/M25/M40 family metallo-hydrolase [Polyangiaceae bacterium]|nr:M20/M25/M40 family metallo-hydrolase [Polyangiaceae bacterium]